MSVLPPFVVRVAAEIIVPLWNNTQIFATNFRAATSKLSISWVSYYRQSDIANHFASRPLAQHTALATLKKANVAMQCTIVDTLAQNHVFTAIKCYFLDIQQGERENKLLIQIPEKWEKYVLLSYIAGVAGSVMWCMYVVVIPGSNEPWTGLGNKSKQQEE